MTSFGEVMDRHRGVGPGFDFLRVFLAVCIVAAHSLLLTGNREWFENSPVGFAEYALVPMFFALSGFLISGSAMRLSLKNFLINRGLRIVPALSVDVVVCALVIGPLVTTVAMSDYFSDRHFWSYFLNSTGYIHYKLPGVFESQLSSNVNGALWTVPYEILCYVIASGFILLAWFHSKWKVVAFTFMVMLMGAVIGPLGLADHAPAALGRFLRFAFTSPESRIVTAFLLGVIGYQWRTCIPHHKMIFIACLAICGLAALLPAYAKAELARFILLPALTYITIFVGLTSVPIPAYFHKGDYSYGIYLYHDPLLHIVIGWFPTLAMLPLWGAAFTFSLGLPMVLVMSNLSWHFVEKPILALRKKFSFVARIRDLGDQPQLAQAESNKPDYATLATEISAKP